MVLCFRERDMAWRFSFDDYKPAVAMVGLQCIFAALAIFSRAALLQGMSPRVFVFYRNAIATVAMAPAMFLSSKYVLFYCFYLFI